MYVCAECMHTTCSDTILYLCIIPRLCLYICTFAASQALQQDVASKQPDVEDVNVKAQSLQAGEDVMLSSTTLLVKRYDTVKTSVKVG